LKSKASGARSGTAVNDIQLINFQIEPRKEVKHSKIWRFDSKCGFLLNMKSLKKHAANEDVSIEIF
jgi:hypothetical protein